MTEGEDDFRFFVNDRQFIWLWQERVDPKRARVPNATVIVTRVADDIRKQMRLQMATTIFFTEPHYDGYNAVLIRLPKIRVALLREVITESYDVVRTTRSGSRKGRRSAPVRRPARG